MRRGWEASPELGLTGGGRTYVHRVEGQAAVLGQLACGRRQGLRNDLPTKDAACERSPAVGEPQGVRVRAWTIKGSCRTARNARTFRELRQRCRCLPTGVRDGGSRGCRWP